MAYRTRTYIAGDWTGDEDLISELQHWNESSYWNISFIDAHELTQARDTSLPCSIKRSLKERLDVSKTFVLIIGDDTKKSDQGRLQILPKLLHLWWLSQTAVYRSPQLH